MASPETTTHNDEDMEDSEQRGTADNSSAVMYSPFGLPITANLSSLGMEEDAEPLTGAFWRSFSGKSPPPPPPQVVEITSAAAPSTAPPPPQHVAQSTPAVQPIADEQQFIVECLRNPDKLQELNDKGEQGIALRQKICVMPE